MLAYTFYESDNRVRRYAESLAKRGDEVDVIALQRDGWPSVEMISGVRVFRIQRRVIDEDGPFSYLRKLLLFFLRSAWVVTRRHLRAPYDFIHVHSVPDFEVFATLIPRLMGARVILDVHDLVPEFYADKFQVRQKSWAFRLLLLTEKLSIAYCNHVIISNHLWYEKITKRSVKPEKCTAIINFPDLSIFSRRPRSASANGDFVMCYPGTLNWHQGVDLAVRAVGLLRDKVPNLKFHIIGKGPDWDKLETLVKQEHLEDRVVMAGLVPIEQVAETMASVDLGVVPKRSDSFGNEAFSTKILEFMAMDVPVVVSRTRIDQYYFTESLVQFFESASVEDLAAKILDLVNDPGKRSALRERGTNFIKENNWEVAKDMYLDLVDGLVERRPVLAPDDAGNGRQKSSPEARVKTDPGGDAGSARQDSKRPVTADSANSTGDPARLLTDRFRCPVDTVARFEITGALSQEEGYFRIGKNVTCFGQCSSGAPKNSIEGLLHDAGEYVRVGGSVIQTTFDPVQIVDQLRSERYGATSTGLKTLPANDLFRAAYYLFRPLLRVSLRRHFQKVYFRGWEKIAFPKWPVDPTVEEIFETLLALSMKSQNIEKVPFIWFWPDAAPTCTMMTHDVETAAGLEFCPQLMDLNDSFGVKSSFQIVPEKRYAVSQSALENIRKRGFEVNVHDLNHDGRLMCDREEFMRRAQRINFYGRQFGALGFRSAVMYRNVNWYDALEFSYDMSVPNVAHLEPQQGGCCTVMPFFVGKMLELPLTTTQDYSLFNILNDYSIRLWKEQISRIREKNGLISFIIHPDYNIDPTARRVYADLLQYLSDLRSDGETWMALPSEVAAWWRMRSQMNLVKAGGSWRIEGQGSERATLAYAVIDHDKLVYEIDHSS